jgi:hypothetical protein
VVASKAAGTGGKSSSWLGLRPGLRSRSGAKVRWRSSARWGQSWSEKSNGAGGVAPDRPIGAHDGEPSGVGVGAQAHRYRAWVQSGDQVTGLVVGDLFGFG